MVYIKKPKYEFEFILDGMEYLRLIERCGRTSYKSKSKLIDEYDTIMQEKDDIIRSKQMHQLFDKVDKIIYELYNRFGRDYYKDYRNRTTLFQHVEDASALQFVDNIIKLGHTSVLEFGWLVIRFYVNIGYTREQNRHRVSSIIERSTRYADECDDIKFGGQLQVISPIWFEGDPEFLKIWTDHMENAEKNYKWWLKVLRERANKESDPVKREKMLKEVPQFARGVLPLDTESEECIGANLREWSESIIRLRASPYAHPSMQQIMYPLRKELRRKIPLIFDYEIKITRELGKDDVK